MEREPLVNASHLAGEVCDILQSYMVTNNFHQVAAIELARSGNDPCVVVYVTDGRVFRMTISQSPQKWSSR